MKNAHRNRFCSFSSSFSFECSASLSRYEFPTYPPLHTYRPTDRPTGPLLRWSNLSELARGPANLAANSSYGIAWHGMVGWIDGWSGQSHRLPVVVFLWRRELRPCVALRCSSSPFIQSHPILHALLRFGLPNLHT